MKSPILRIDYRQTSFFRALLVLRQDKDESFRSTEAYHERLLWEHLFPVNCFEDHLGFNYLITVCLSAYAPLTQYSNILYPSHMPIFPHSSSIFLSLVRCSILEQRCYSLPPTHLESHTSTPYTHHAPYTQTPFQLFYCASRPQSSPADHPHALLPCGHASVIHATSYPSQISVARPHYRIHADIHSRPFLTVPQCHLRLMLYSLQRILVH